VGSTVHALATAVRVQVLLRSSKVDADAESLLAEFAIGGVEALAIGPSGGYVKPGAAAPPAPAAPAERQNDQGARNVTTGLAPNLEGQAATGPSDGAGDQAGSGDPADLAAEGATGTGPPTPTRAGRTGTGRKGDTSQGARGGGAGGGFGDETTSATDGSGPLHEYRITLILGTGALLIGIVRFAGALATRRRTGAWTRRRS
jgi:hypothetical protein